MDLDLTISESEDLDLSLCGTSLILGRPLLSYVPSVLSICNPKRHTSLQLNTNKTEVMMFGSATNLSKLSAAEKLIKIGPDTNTSAVVRDRGVYFDSELNMKSHISQITCVLLPSASSASCSPSARPGNNSTSSLGIRFVATRLL